jgi:hypothetical protein
MLPQIRIGPNMARTMVEDSGGVKVWRQGFGSTVAFQFRSVADGPNEQHAAAA